MSASSGSVEVIKFNERFCGKKVGPKVDKRSVQNESSETKEDNISNVKEFNIKRARYEVMRFGLSGFDKERQKKDKIAIAIRLGAKPPKREYVNYKALIEEKKKEKSEQKNKQNHNQYVLKQLKSRKKCYQRKRKQRLHQYYNVIF